MTSPTRTNWKSLIAWLLVCPAAFLAGVILLSPQTSLYQSRAESLLLLVIFLPPVVGVLAIFRLLRATRGARMAAAGAYLAITLPMAALTAIFISCSWAGACF